MGSSIAVSGILDNQTELPIEKHTTDTAGYSDIIFALFDLLGLQFAPRLAGLPDRRLYRLGLATWTPAGRLLAHPLNPDVIRDGWDDLVRCAASLRDGTLTGVRLASEQRRGSSVSGSSGSGALSVGRERVAARRQVAGWLFGVDVVAAGR